MKSVTASETAVVQNVVEDSATAEAPRQKKVHFETSDNDTDSLQPTEGVKYEQ